MKLVTDGKRWLNLDNMLYATRQGDQIKITWNVAESIYDDTTAQGLASLTVSGDTAQELATYLDNESEPLWASRLEQIA